MVKVPPAGSEVYRINWIDGLPVVETGTVTRVTKTTYYVGTDKRHSTGWFPSLEEAFGFAYRSIFFEWDTLFSPKEKDYDIEDSVLAICELRELHRIHFPSLDS